MKAQIWNKNVWINEIDPIKLKNIFSELLGLSGFDILNFQEHYFEPIGWTGLWLLGESHFAIHTFPEEKKSYIEISSCNEDYYNYFISNLITDNQHDTRNQNQKENAIFPNIGNANYEA